MLNYVENFVKQLILSFFFFNDLSVQAFFFFKKLYLFLAALGHHCCTQAFSSCSEWGYTLVVVLRLLTQSQGSKVHGLQQSWCTVLMCHVESSQSRVRTHAPALAGGFLTLGPLGKSRPSLCYIYIGMCYGNCMNFLEIYYFLV